MNKLTVRIEGNDLPHYREILSGQTDPTIGSLYYRDESNMLEWYGNSQSTSVIIGKGQKLIIELE